MNLALILAGKSRTTITASPDSTLHDVVQTLSGKGIGAILVTGPDEGLLGIISERDVVHAIARSGAKVLDETVRAHMTSRVITATSDTSVAEAMETMTSGRFRHIPVMRGSVVEGVVSIGDLVKHRLSEMEHENKALHAYITAA